MHKGISHIISNIVFGVLCIGLFYLRPFIAWHTMEGDKTEILMGEMFAVIPIGLLLISFLYGIFVKKVIQPICIASIISIPAVLFIPFIGGITIWEKVLSFVFIIMMLFIIVGIGTVLGIFIRKKDG